MKNLFFIVILFFFSCKERVKQKSVQIRKYIPDSTSGFYAKQFYEDYKRTRKIERSLKLLPTSDGSRQLELRFWNLSSYDPQSIYILKIFKPNESSLRAIKYHSSPSDSIVSEINMDFILDIKSMLNVDRIWTLTSQSEMINGDSLGCLDGNTILMELSDASRYKYFAFRCPEIHLTKDSAFYYVNKLGAGLRSLAKEE